MGRKVNKICVFCGTESTKRRRKSCPECGGDMKDAFLFKDNNNKFSEQGRVWDGESTTQCHDP